MWCCFLCGSWLKRLPHMHTHITPWIFGIALGALNLWVVKQFYLSVAQHNTNTTTVWCCQADFRKVNIDKSNWWTNGNKVQTHRHLPFSANEKCERMRALRCTSSFVFRNHQIANYRHSWCLSIFHEFLELMAMKGDCCLLQLSNVYTFWHACGSLCVCVPGPCTLAHTIMHRTFK